MINCFYRFHSIIPLRHKAHLSAKVIEPHRNFWQ